MCLGGLWAPPLVGAVLLAVARGPGARAWRWRCWRALLLLTLALWVRSPAGFIAVPACAALLGWAAWRWQPARRLLLAQFLAITLALDTVGRLVGYALSSSATVGGHERKSDVAGDRRRARRPLPRLGRARDYGCAGAACCGSVGGVASVKKPPAVASCTRVSTPMRRPPSMV